MNYIKFSVEIFITYIFVVAAEIHGSLDHNFITTDISYNLGVLRIYFCVIFCETRQHEKAHITFCKCYRALCQPLAEETRQLTLLASVGYGGCRVS
jgi:hypothetical protein